MISSILLNPQWYQRLPLLLPLILLFAGPGAQAASFDCTQASSPIEKTICSDNSLSELDTQLGQHYRNVLDVAEDSVSAKVKEEQRLWLKQRNSCANAQCMADRYTQRISELVSLYQQAIYAGKDIEVTSVLEQNYDNAASIVVRFNIPLDRNADFRNRLQISQDGKQLDASNWLINEDGVLAVYPFIEPSAEYSIQVKPGLRAINGHTHSANRSFSVKSRRSVPSASFASSGQVMSNHLRPALPVVTLDVDEVDVDFFHLAPTEIAEWSHFSNSQRRAYYELEGFTRKNPLIYSARFPITHKRHQRTTTNLDLSGIPALQKNGAYLAVLRIPGNYSYQFETNFFTVSDIGVQVRRSEKGMHILANSIATGEALEGIEISLYQGKELKASQTTANNGIASFSNWFNGTNTLIAHKGEQYSILRLDQPMDLSGITNATTRHQQMQVFAWGPRDLYRPGEKLETYAIVRDHDGRPLSDTPLRASLLNATGAQLINATLNREADGSYHFTHQLTDNAKPGQWKLIYRNPGTDKILTEYSFSVEEFMPERMELTLFDGDPLRRRLVYDINQLKIPVAGDYLYGAPASGNAVDGYLLAELDRHPFEQWNSYSFGIDQENIPNARYTLPKITLDAAGKAEWAIDLANWKNVNSPLALTTTASLYESGGRPVTRTLSATRIQQQEMVGIEPQFKDQAANDSRVGFKLILTDDHGAPRAGNYQYVLIREDRNYYWTYDDNGGWNWHYDPMEYESYSGKLQFTPDQAVTIQVPVEWGNYRLEVRNKSNTTVSSYRFRTSWYWWGNSESGAAVRPDQVSMGFRDKVYQAGDKAHLLLTPATAGLATITVEDNDSILWVSQLDVEAKKTHIEIPIMPDWSRHDIYVTATILSPGDMQHSVSPKRAFGFINLPLRRKDAAFDVSIEVPEKIEPLQHVSARVRLSGNPILHNTYVTLAAVDVGVLNITRFKTPDPVSQLYGARRYEASYYDIYGQIIDNAGFDYSQQRFGGGFAQSEAELSRGGDKPKNDVQIVSLQSAPVLVNADGVASVEIDIPEFNGKLRWMAIAYSEQTFGSAEASSTVAEKLVTQLSKPRFLALDDQSELTLDLTNMSGLSQNLKVSLKTSGALQAQQWDKTLILADAHKDTLRFPITAQQIGEGNIELSVHNDVGAKDALSLTRSWKLGVRYAYPAVTRKAMEIINPGKTWQPQIALNDLVSDSVQAQLILSSQPPIDVNSQFEHLLKYPYGCTEQSTSSGYPWVLVDLDAAARMKLLPIIQREFKKEYSADFRKQQIEKAVQRITPRQNSSGGFGLWSGSDNESYWLTAYVTDFLTDAELAGADVDREVLDKAIRRLQEYLQQRVQFSSRWGSDDQYYSFATRAYAAYVLAKINRARLSDLRRLYSATEKSYEDTPLPWAHLGYALDKAGDNKRATAAFDKARGLKHSGQHHGYYDSELRDLSLSYAILAARGKASAETLLTIFELTKKRQWLSTQERNALFKAALAADTQTGEALLALIQTRDFKQPVDQAEAFKSILNYQQLESLQSISSQDSTVYASLEVIGNQSGLPQPESNGFSIKRDYFDIDGKAIQLSELKGGEMVVVRINVSATEHTPNALIVDLLPAGFELENQNLANTSVDLSRIAIDGNDLKDWQSKAQIEHVEYRDDRFVAALAVDEYGSRDIFYLARAVTPGSYRVPPPLIEDMYRPYHRGVGSTVETVRITRP